ncbi:MAG: sensor histidine kinase [Synergistaceae bacterium]|nr:sensor histidine kinase [Synergistaceae bacterium]
MLRRKLLTVLFIIILLPILVVLFESVRTFMSQKISTTDTAGRYVQSLADYASDRWNDGKPAQITAFLSLVADSGYNRLIRGEKVPSKDANDRNASARRDKFIPGMVAYVTFSGRVISSSENADILAGIFTGSMAETSGRAADNGNIVGSFMFGGNRVSYVAHISATRNRMVYAVAAVTMLSWMGRNDFNFDMMKLAFAGTLGMLICLVGLFLLRSSVIKPLQALSSQVETTKWGKETPEFTTNGIFGRLRVEEISSLKKAVNDLACRMIDKESLEKRYVGDIIKAQEDERGRIAQDIHDGPIQVVSALIQRIQMLNIASCGMPSDASRQLADSEDIAQNLVEDLRDICDSLVPPWVSLGLASCIEEASSRFERQHSITVNAVVDPALNVSQETTLALFRIFQEAVSNAVRHGNADTVSVEASLCGGGRTLEFIISDNGTGFILEAETPDTLVQKGQRGLTGMRRRVELLGGEFEIKSARGDGTEITVRI